MKALLDFVCNLLLPAVLLAVLAALIALGVVAGLDLIHHVLTNN